jgi:hypothetical protein
MSKALTEARRRFAIARTERGAADPMLVIGSIAVLLVLLLGGAFGVIAWINSSHDSNAQSNLDKVAIAESSYFANNTAYIAYDNQGTGALKDLETKAQIGFTPSAEGRLVVLLTGKGWVAVSKSASQDGNIYVRTDAGPQIAQVNSAGSAFVTSDAKKKAGADAVTAALADANHGSGAVTIATIVNAVK